MWHTGCMAAIKRDPASGLNAAVAAELRAERAARRVSVAELSERSGVSRSTLLRVLNTERAISMESLFALSEALGVSASSLVQRAENRLSEESVDTAHDDVVPDWSTMAARVVYDRPEWNTVGRPSRQASPISATDEDPDHRHDGTSEEP